MSTQSVTMPSPRRHELPTIMNYIVLLLSLGLIIWISYDTLNKINILEDSRYMTFQLWVCVFFILDFFVELVYQEDKWRFFRHRILFLILSIPYLNIISVTGLDLGPDALYFIRFIPLARGALAMSIVVGYLSDNAVTSVFISYIVIMIAVAYFGSLILFEREYGINPQMTTYSTALWMSCMNLTTVGSPINPVTPAGKIVLVILPICGMIMFPLFTVYLTDYLTRNSRKNKNS